MRDPLEGGYKMTKEERMQALRVNLTNWNFEVDSHFTLTSEDAGILIDILDRMEHGYKLCKIYEMVDHAEIKSVTNAEKFEEVFGFRPQTISGAPECLGIPCPKGNDYGSGGCVDCDRKKFWSDKYKAEK